MCVYLSVYVHMYRLCNFFEVAYSLKRATLELVGLYIRRIQNLMFWHFSEDFWHFFGNVLGHFWQIFDTFLANQIQLTYGDSEKD